MDSAKLDAVLDRILVLYTKRSKALAAGEGPAVQRFKALARAILAEAMAGVVDDVADNMEEDARERDKYGDMAAFTLWDYAEEIRARAAALRKETGVE